MSSPIAVYVRRDIYEWCETKVSQGRFRTFSDILDYAMGFYLDSITTGRVKAVMKIAKGERVRRSVRVNEQVLDGLIGTGFFDRSEIADYALDFYRGWLEGEYRFGRLLPGFRHLPGKRTSLLYAVMVMCQNMTETKIVAMPVPRMLAADLVFYTGETGLFLNEKDLVLHAVRSLFLDTYNGFDGELEEWMNAFRQYERVGPEQGRIEVEVPVELFDAITDIYPDRGYGFSEFVCIALTRQISFLTQYCEDELS